MSTTYYSPKISQYQTHDTNYLQKPHYEDVRTCFEQLGDLRGWEDEEETDDGAKYKEEKHYDIARFFNLEATMHLERWQDAVGICASDDSIPGPRFYPQIMDLTLRLNLPPERAIWLIKVRCFSWDRETAYS